MRLRVCVVTQQRPVAEGQAGSYCRTLWGTQWHALRGHCAAVEASYARADDVKAQMRRAVPVSLHVLVATQ